MKSYKMFCILLLFTSCSYKSKTPDKGLFHRESLMRSVPSNGGMIISCFRCGCIDNFVAALIKQKIPVPVYGDSSCVKERPLNFRHLSQNLIDTIYERNYNAILFKQVKSADQFEYKVLANEDADDFLKIFNKFFEKKH